MKIPIMKLRCALITIQWYSLKTYKTRLRWLCGSLAPDISDTFLECLIQTVDFTLYLSYCGYTL